MERESGTKQTHLLTLEGRERAQLTGVMAVICFHEQEVALETSEGEVALLGRGLHIEQLNLEEGRIDVTGEIEGIEYNGPRAKKDRGGLFGRRKKPHGS